SGDGSGAGQLGVQPDHPGARRLGLALARGRKLVMDQPPTGRSAVAAGDRAPGRSTAGEPDSERKDGETVLPPLDPQRKPAPELSLRPEARQLVLEGMARVGRPGGTAAPMSHAMARLAEFFPNERVDLYSKTGSPFLEWSVPRQAPRALEGLVRNSRLRIEGKSLAVRSNQGDIPYALPQQPGRFAFRDALTRALKEVKLGSVATPRMISYLADLLDDFAEDLQEVTADTEETPIA